jgi:DNA-binding response OmpR family regulator
LNVKKILSVDDEPMILECIKDALTRQGYEIETTGDPREGLRRLTEEDDIDLALLDVKMPGLSGFDIYRAYRQVRKTPAIFVTAYPGSFNASSDEVMDMWQNEFADGTTDIVYKPFDLEILFDKIEAMIGGPGDESGHGMEPD